MSTAQMADQARTDENEAEPTVDPAASDQDLIVEELLVEEVSIDGMCGVY